MMWKVLHLAVGGVGDYMTFFDAVGLSQGGPGGIGNMAGGGSSDGKSLEDLFYQKEMELCKVVFLRVSLLRLLYMLGSSYGSR